MKGRKQDNPTFSADQAAVLLGHELGNVLNGLLGMTQLLRDSGLSAEQDRWVRAIEQSGWQLQRLVEAHHPDRLESAELVTPKAVRLDGIELLEQALLSHVPIARNRSNWLLLNIAPDLPRYWRCDPRMLRQLLDNLLSNALKFTCSGEVAVEAATAGATTGEPDALVLSVVDSGPGIDKHVANRMFKPFVRGSDYIEEESPGYGLGLFICRQLARAMGGEIEWSAPVSGGARFEVLLPGVLDFGQEAGPLPTRVLKPVRCILHLDGGLLHSVSGCLSRLGVSWRDAGPGQRDSLPTAMADTLSLSIRELTDGAAHQGPQLLLQSHSENGRVWKSRVLSAPVLECSLGPQLLELALEWHWLRNGTPGSVR